MSQLTLICKYSGQIIREYTKPILKDIQRSYTPSPPYKLVFKWMIKNKNRTVHGDVTKYCNIRGKDTQSSGEIREINLLTALNVLYSSYRKLVYILFIRITNQINESCVWKISVFYLNNYFFPKCSNNTRHFRKDTER